MRTGKGGGSGAQRLYLDTCCLSRPFDDQTQARVRLEAEAVLMVMAGFVERGWEWVASDVVWREASRIPDQERCGRMMGFRIHVRHHVLVQPPILDRTDEIEPLGPGGMDALHVACAEFGGADVFLTTDDGLLKGFAANQGRPGLAAANPLAWLEKEGASERGDR